jgi:release factor glutamine methyltransferase
MIGAGATVAALQAQLPLPPLERRMLLCHVLRLPRVALITQDTRALTAAEAAALSDLVERRLDGEPMAYLLGTREFFGLPFEVNPAVLIPRPDTELLVEQALAHLPRGGRVLDMGTGSGAIAVAIAHSRPDAQVTALDTSTAALEVAQRNATTHGVRVRFLHSDWFSALAPDAPFDLIVSNPPYVASGDPHLADGDLRFEPIGALTDHADGLSALRIIVAGATRHLGPDGCLLLEHGYDQAAVVRALLTGDGWAEVRSWTDLAGIERVTGGRRAPSGVA